MRAWKSALAIACFGLGAAVLAPAHAQGISPGGPPKPGGSQGQPTGQPQGNQFQFRVCNKTSIELFVAIMFKPDANWRTVGWAPYKPGECAPLRGTFSRTEFFWYAEDAPGNITYPGKDAFGCVNPSDNFNRTITGDYACGDGEKIAGFTKIDDGTINNGLTLTD